MRSWLAALIVIGATTLPGSAQQPKVNAATTPVQLPTLSPADAATAAAVLAFEKQMEVAVVKGDVKYLATIIPADFTFTHGDGWTSGGQPIRVDTKDTWLASVAKQPYLTRDLGPVAVEVHDDIVITYGRYKMRQKSAPSGAETSVWFERVYAKRAGHWMYLSHRTVHGPSREEPSPSTSK